MNEEYEVKKTILDENIFFKAVIQNAAAPMFVIDISHKIIIWNNALAKLTGKSSFQMVGTKQQWVPFYPTKRPVLAELVSGMTIARDVESGSGVLLMQRGSILDETGVSLIRSQYRKNHPRQGIFVQILES